MFYTEKSGCPYSFLFAPTDISSFDGTTESGDRICGVVSNQDNAIIFNNAKVGMEHREFEAEIGEIYTAAMDNEAEYDCPSATFSVEATSFLDGKRHEYTLVRWNLSRGFYAKKHDFIKMIQIHIIQTELRE